MNENLEKTLSDLIQSKNSSPEGHLVVDVYQNKNEIIIQSAIAGVKGEHIDLSIAKDAVTITGFRERTEQTDPADYLHQEMHWGQFSRSVILPAEIDIAQAGASIKNGILTIRLPKLAKEI